MRAAIHKHYIKKERRYRHSEVTDRKIPFKKCTVFKAIAFVCAIVSTFVALAIPTATTLTTSAPDIDTYKISKETVSISEPNPFSAAITNNCVDSPVVEPTVAPPTEPSTAEVSDLQGTNTSPIITEDPPEVKSEEPVEQVSGFDDNASNLEKNDSANNCNNNDSFDNSGYKCGNNDCENDYSNDNNVTKHPSGFLLDISNADPNYSPSRVNLSPYDRAKLERLVMGESGSLGYLGCALVAQAIRDAMNRSGTNSIDQIISQYQYSGSTSYEPNADVRNAVSFIFDENGSAVQHRVLVFYTGTSAWHETQTFIAQIGTERFFDMNC